MMRFSRPNADFHFSLRLAILVVLIVAAGLLCYKSLSPRQTESIRAVDTSALPLGPWKWHEPLFVYLDDKSQPTGSMTIDSTEEGSRFVHLELDKPSAYSGFGIRMRRSVPPDASLVLRWRSVGSVPFVQIDLMDGSPSGSGPDGGENFFTTTPPPGPEWKDTEIPFNILKRNDYQGERAPNDGAFDTDGIRRLTFTLYPGAKIRLDVQDIRFAWSARSWEPALILCMSVFLGLFLLLRTTRTHVPPPGEDELFSTGVTSRIVFLLAAVAAALSAVQPGLRYSPQSDLIPYAAVWGILCIDEFADLSQLRERIWRLRYIAVVLILWVFDLSPNPLSLFFLVLAGYVPAIQYRSSACFWCVPALACLGLLANPHPLGPHSWVAGAVFIGNTALFAGLFKEFLSYQSARSETRHTTTLYEDLFRNTPDGIYTFSRSGSVERINPGFERILGLSRSEIVGRSILDFVHPEDHGVLPFERGCLSMDGSRQYDMRFINGLGEIRHALVNEHAIRRDSSLVGYQAIATDITERKQAQAERARLEEQLRQSQKMEAIGQLAGGVAHDFNNLLTGIVGNLGLAEIHASESVHRYLTRAREAATRAGNLVRQLLAFSRRSQVEMKSVDLNKIVDEVYRLARQTIDRRIEMVVHTEEGIPNVLASSTQINSVVMNLCVNARDAISEVMDGRAAPERRNDPFVIRIATETTVIGHEYCRSHSEARLGRFVVLSVSDNGAGMDPEIRRRIFDPFFTTKEIGKGTGLGLATVYGIVKRHGGWINVYSEPGKVTVFKIYLPVPDKDVQERTSAEDEDTLGGTESILLVDDEEMIRDLGLDILEQYGYTVLLAGDGQEGLDLYFKERERIDLVILDLSMPNLSGAEVLEQIHSRAPGAKVIISSGYAKDGRSESLQRMGAMAYVGKPYQPAELARVVRRALDGISEGSS